MSQDDLRIRLLVKSVVKPAFSETEVNLNDENWHLAEYTYNSSTKRSDLPSFACISYRWFGGREPNPFYQDKYMSTLTLPSLATAMRNSTTLAFWIDAFCVPPQKPLKTRTLENMGLIYHLATEVLVVLSGCRFDTMMLMSGTDSLSSHLLRTIENAVYDLNADEWVKSIWTYQESVNSRQYYFIRGRNIDVGENSRDIVIQGAKFFNRVGEIISIYKTAKKINSYDVCRMLPNLNALEDLMVDWQLSGFLKRSALQVISNLDRRLCQSPMDYFYSLIGSITDEIVSRRPSQTIIEVCETFIKICEKKRDFSFIYTATQRNNKPGRRRWYPLAGPLRSVLPWHSGGEKQRGEWDERGLWLESMVLIDPSPTLGSVGKTFITQWHQAVHLQLPSQFDGDSDFAIAIRSFAVLQAMGFTGSIMYILTPSGIFFPQEPVQRVSELIVATDVSWVFGAPGLVKTYVRDEVQYTTGVFVGQTASAEASPVLLEGTKWTEWDADEYSDEEWAERNEDAKDE
ncbi:hypothetical protein H2198_006388 [Neophaeococcomyces mojaviensis]|uniref:Uncharacterized protein n=1 Tax=Neophaeococcomyces mojaviensis TaxID=3383035 RepID=A0ACC3A2X7_9EURO|nr:hypothetical protein H2198_006388 [Knufia sp. JES_112]